MPNVRLMTVGGLPRTFAVNGRTYTFAANGYLDVPDFDAYVMLADAFINAAPGATVGPTTARPTKPSKGQNYHDTTLGYTIVHDTINWRNPATGAVV
jgi:hypothetical protein